jgi:hypothetical protein
VSVAVCIDAISAHAVIAYLIVFLVLDALLAHAALRKAIKQRIQISVTGIGIRHGIVGILNHFVLPSSFTYHTITLPTRHIKAPVAAVIMFSSILADSLAEQISTNKPMI